MSQADVHQVGEPGARGAGADLAEHHLTVRRPVPLHVREAAGEAHRRDHRLAHPAAAGEVLVVGVAVGDHLLADPLDLLADERTWAVLGDVVEGDLAVGAHRVVGELLAVDELLDADLVDVQQPGRGRPRARRVLDAVGVERAGAGDRLDDQRVADALGRLPAPGGRRRRARHAAMRIPAASSTSFIRPLSRKGSVCGDGHPRRADGFAQPRREQHGGFPQRLDEVDVATAQAIEDRRHRPVLVGPRGDLDVVGERPPGDGRERVDVLVADADDARARRRRARV